MKITASIRHAVSKESQRRCDVLPDSIARFSVIRHCVLLYQFISGCHDLSALSRNYCDLTA